MKLGEIRCVVCKRIYMEGQLNGFSECDNCYGTFMKELRKNDGPLFPAEKKKNPWMNGGKKSGGSWRQYGNVKKDIATPLDEAPTIDEEKALTELV